MKQFVLRATDRAGAFGYYTGKAGPEWVSNKIENAFPYESFTVACNKAINHNKFQQIHGFYFLVCDLEKLTRKTA